MAKSLKLGLLVAIPLLLATCKKETVTTPDPPEESLLTFYLSKDSVACGDSMQIRIVCNKNIQMTACYMSPGKVVTGIQQGPFDKTFRSGRLYYTTQLVCYTEYGKTFKVPIKVYEKVKEPERTRLLTQKPWKLVDFSTVLLNGNLYANWNISPEEKNFFYYYYIDHKAEALPSGTISNPNNLSAGWYFSGSYLITGNPGQNEEINRDSIILSETEFIRFHPSLIDSSGVSHPPTLCWDKFTYHH